MKCAITHCGRCQFGPTFVCRDGPVFRYVGDRAAASRCGSSDGRDAQAEARGLEVRLLRRLPAQPARLRGRAARRSPAQLEIAYFLEATRGDGRGPLRPLAGRGLDHDRRTTPSASSEVRARLASGWSRSAPAPPPAGSRRCATSPTSTSSSPPSTPSPEYISTLDTSTPISDHVTVDFELQGCPINKHQLLEVISAYLHGAPPNIPPHSVCMECKRRGNVCVMVAHGTPCLGPVTHAGCGALCPSYDRGCYGCYGPMETPNTGLADRAGWGAARRRPARARPRLPHLQRQRAGLPGRERRSRTAASR